MDWEAYMAENYIIKKSEIQEKGNEKQTSTKYEKKS